MSGHTPGPLVAVREPSHPLDGLWMVALAGEITTCTASYCTEADAKLYAAAPELLEAGVKALEAIDNILPAHRGQHEYAALLGAFHALQAAIAKADGASQ